MPHDGYTLAQLLAPRNTYPPKPPRNPFRPAR